jgi:hypothetical protein
MPVRDVRRGAVVVAAIGAAAVLAGLVAGRLAETLIERPAPVAAPPVPASGEVRYVPGLRASVLERDLVRSGYVCQPQSAAPRTLLLYVTAHSVVCSLAARDHPFQVVHVYYDGDGEVGEITASCLPPSGASRGACGPFFDAVGRLAFPAGSPLGAQAGGGASGHAGADAGSTTVGPLYLQVVGHDASQRAGVRQAVESELDCLPAR